MSHLNSFRVVLSKQFAFSPRYLLLILQLETTPHAHKRKTSPNFCAANISALILVFYSFFFSLFPFSLLSFLPFMLSLFIGQTHISLGSFSFLLGCKKSQEGTTVISHLISQNWCSILFLPLLALISFHTACKHLTCSLVCLKG